MLQTAYNLHSDRFTLDRIYLRSVPQMAKIVLEAWVAKVLNRQIVDLDTAEVIEFIWSD